MIIINLLVIGELFSCPLETVVFLYTFPALRKYTGGAHASNRRGCYLVTISIDLIALWCTFKMHKFCLMIIAFASCWYICKYAPICHENNVLNLRQQQWYGIISKKRAILFTFIPVSFLAFYDLNVCSMILSTVIINGGNIFMLKKSTPNKGILRNKLINLLVTFVLFIGTNSLVGTCRLWNYQPKITAGLRKYIDK